MTSAMKPTNLDKRHASLIAITLIACCASLGMGGCSNKPKQQEVMLADLQKENDDLRAQAQQAQDSLAQAQTRVTELESENATLKTTAKPTAGPADTARASGSDRVLSIAGDVAFNPGQTTLTSAGKREVDKVIAEIKSKWGGHRIEIAGYTDSSPLKKTKSKYTDNENLSAQRALAVERYLNSKGISPDLTHSSAYGPSESKGSKQASRRVEIRIMAN